MTDFRYSLLSFSTVAADRSSETALANLGTALQQEFQAHLAQSIHFHLPELEMPDTLEDLAIEMQNFTQVCEAFLQLMSWLETGYFPGSFPPIDSVPPMSAQPTGFRNRSGSSSVQAGQRMQERSPSPLPTNPFAILDASNPLQIEETLIPRSTAATSNDSNPKMGDLGGYKNFYPPSSPFLASPSTTVLGINSGFKTESFEEDGQKPVFSESAIPRAAPEVEPTISLLSEQTPVTPNASMGAFPNPAKSSLTFQGLQQFVERLKGQTDEMAIAPLPLSSQDPPSKISGESPTVRHETEQMRAANHHSRRTPVGMEPEQNAVLGLTEWTVENDLAAQHSLSHHTSHSQLENLDSQHPTLPSPHHRNVDIRWRQKVDEQRDTGLSELDLEQILEAIALEIQRDYHQFYGS